MEDTDIIAGNRKETSFRDMLMGRLDESMQEEDEEGNSEEDEKQTPEEDQEQDYSIIGVSKEEKQRIRRPWKKTLIIKLLGRNIGFHHLQRKLKETWKPKSPLELIAIENGYFLAKFLFSGDYEFAKYEGPWMIFGIIQLLGRGTQILNPTKTR